jgi:hypothetical protein
MSIFGKSRKTTNAVPSADAEASTPAPKAASAGGCDHDWQFVGRDVNRNKYACTKCGAVDLRDEPGRMI